MTGGWDRSVVLADTDLTEPEQRLIAAIAEGSALDLRPADPAVDALATEPLPQRAIRAELLGELLTGVRRPDGDRSHRLALYGAHVTGELRLAGAELVRSLTLDNCVCTAAVTLAEARTKSLRLLRCLLPGLRLDHAHVDGVVDLWQTSLTGGLKLGGTTVVGDVRMLDSTIAVEDGVTVDAANLTVANDLVCIGLRSTGGSVRLAGARAAGVELFGATLHNPGGVALDARRLRVDGDLRANEISVEGQLDLDGAELGRVELLGATVTNPGGKALTGNGMKVSRDLACAAGFTSTGSVDLVGAKIDGDLSFSGATLTNADGTALRAQAIVVGQSAFFRETVCVGVLDLSDATVDHMLSLRGADLEGHHGLALAGTRLRAGILSGHRLRAGGGLELVTSDLGLLDLSGATLTALTANGAKVAGDVQLGGGFVTHGLVDLAEATVEGRLDCTAATFDRPGNTAFTARAARIDRGAAFDRITCNGTLDLAHATITGSVELQDAHLHQPGGYALVATRLRVAGNVRAPQLRSDGELHLADAHVGHLGLAGAQLDGTGGSALAAYGLTVDHDLLANAGLTATGMVDLYGARIGGFLDCCDASLTNPTGTALRGQSSSIANGAILRGVTCSGQLDLANAQVEGPLDLSGSTVVRPTDTAVNGYGLTVRNDLLLEDGFVARGTVELSSARVGGQLRCVAATFHRPTGPALNALGLVVGQSAHLRKAYCVGRVELTDAEIDGSLDLSEATLCNPAAAALLAQGLRVAGNLFGRGLTCLGECNLALAKLGRAELSGATFAHHGGVALEAFGVTVQHDLLCDEYFAVRGTLGLSGARIGGDLGMGSARLDNRGRTALDASMLHVEKTADCSELAAEGSVVLDGAQLTELWLSSASLRNPADVALSVVSATVSRDVGLCCTAEGAVVLTDTRIGGSLDLATALLDCPGGRALDAEGLTVDGDAFLGQQDDPAGGPGLVATGLINLGGATVGGQLRFEQTTFGVAEGTSLDLSYGQATTLWLRPAAQPAGAVNLVNAKVDRLRDDPATWADTVRLRGFVYEVLDKDRAGVRTRLARWVSSERAGGFQPGVYEQLAAAYRRAGRLQDARAVGLAKQRRSRGELSWLGKVLHVLFAVTVGYGYRTWLAAVWLAGLLTAGTAVYALSSPSDLRPATADPPDFQPFAYALDVLIPVVDLGQQVAWLADGPALVCSWLLITGGWVLTTAVVAGLTNALRRE